MAVVADGGYFEGTTIKECEEAGIITYVPIEETPRKGIFPRSQFQYDDENDLYVCPAGAELRVIHHKSEGEKEIKVYGTSACHGCALKAQCTTSKRAGRKIERWVHQEVIDRQAERNRRQPQFQRQRGSLIEHVFGTLKRAMGHTYFLT